MSWKNNVNQRLRWSYAILKNKLLLGTDCDGDRRNRQTCLSGRYMLYHRLGAMQCMPTENVYRYVFMLYFKISVSFMLYKHVKQLHLVWKLNLKYIYFIHLKQQRFLHLGSPPFF